MCMQLTPVFGGEIDDDETGRGQTSIKSLATFHISRCDQAARELVQTWIVTDHEQRAGAPSNLSDHCKDRFRGRSVETLLVDRDRRLRKRIGDALPGFARALGW